LTLSRLLLGLGFAWVYMREGSPWLLLAIVIVAAVTDWLDGLTARKLQAVSTLGKLLDPFADALFCMIVFYAVMRQQPDIVPPWIFYVLVGREMVVTFLLRPIALARKLVIAASPLGKIKTVLQFVVIIACVALMLPALEGAASAVFWLAKIGVVLVLFFSVAAALLYVKKTVRALREQPKAARHGTADPGGPSSV
jgi:CDP-diacylglycerol--glycerol-3-phosphate 3-phosphatidyltransferase